MDINGSKIHFGGNQGYLFFLLRVFMVFLDSRAGESLGVFFEGVWIDPESPCSILKDSS